MTGVDAIQQYMRDQVERFRGREFIHKPTGELFKLDRVVNNAFVFVPVSGDGRSILAVGSQNFDVVIATNGLELVK